MTIVEGTWHQNYSLLPTGKLTLLTCDLHQTEHLIKVKVLAVDEIGAIFDVSRPTFVFEIKCQKLPENLHAHYWFKHKYGSMYVALAHNQQQALEKLFQAYPSTYTARDDFTLVNVAGPLDQRAIAYTNTQFQRN